MTELLRGPIPALREAPAFFVRLRGSISVDKSAEVGKAVSGGIVETLFAHVAACSSPKESSPPRR